jgi:hypothetical protein
MFDFLRNLFHGSTEAGGPATPEPVAAAPTTAAGTQIHYDPTLIDRLMADHKHVVGLFGKITAAAKAKDANSLAPLLGEFGAAVRSHLLTENVRFYIYVQHNCDAEQAGVVHGFQHEMREIGRVLTDFLFRYSKQEQWFEADWSQFIRELGQIGQVLTRRIATEENTLYPLYKPPV